MWESQLRQGPQDLDADALEQALANERSMDMLMSGSEVATPVECEVQAQIPAEALRLDEHLALRDGSKVRVRAIRPDDIERLRAFHASLSFETIVYRFFRALPELPADLAQRFTHVDYCDRMALVATQGVGADAELLAVVRYDRVGPAEAEVAFVVQDRWQGHGIATALLYRLAAYARAHGIATFVAITLGNNQPMLDVLRYCGFPRTSSRQDGEVEVRLDISRDISRDISQDISQDISRDICRDIGRDIGRDISQDISADVSRPLGHAEPHA